MDPLSYKTLFPMPGRTTTLNLCILEHSEKLTLNKIPWRQDSRAVLIAQAESNTAGIQALDYYAVNSDSKELLVLHSINQKYSV